MSKILISVIIFSSILFSHSAQGLKEDSLMAIFNELDDPEEKVSFCMETGRLYISNDWSSFEFWMKKGIEIGEKTHQHRIIQIYSELSYEAVSLGKLENAAEYISKGKSAINSETPVDFQYSILSSEADYYLRSDQFGMSKQIGRKIIDLADNNNDTLDLTAALHNLGINYYKEGDIETADSLISVAYDLNKEINYEPFILNNLSMLANIATKQGKIEKALEYNLIVLEKFISQNNLSSTAMVKVNVSGNYYALGQKGKAYSIVNEGIALAKEHGFKRWEWIGLMKLSVYYEEDGRYKEALESYILSTELKSSVVNQESALKLNSLTEELNQKQLEVFENKEALQDARLIVQDEKIKLQTAENNEKKILNYVLVIGLLAACMVGFFIYNRLKLTNKQNVIIQEQKVKVDLAYDQLEEKSQEITDSIVYAKRIQLAILPPDKVIKSYLAESFILYKPKDIVAGDFYWFHELNGSKMIAACDCTGHGVPGALVSLICNNSLNRAVKEFGLTDPGLILDKTRELVIQEFSKSEEEVKDGMDIALCKLDGNTLLFAGAHNPLWIVRNKEIIEIKGDKQPIGAFDKLKAYNTHKMDLEPNDTFYIFTDGYPDQFGGVKGKKLKTKAFKNLLISLEDLPMKEQKKSIDNTFEEWKGNFEQLDDVCVIGVRV